MTHLCAALVCALLLVSSALARFHGRSVWDDIIADHDAATSVAAERAGQRRASVLWGAIRAEFRGTECFREASSDGFVLELCVERFFRRIADAPTTTTTTRDDAGDDGDDFGSSERRAVTYYGRVVDGDVSVSWKRGVGLVMRMLHGDACGPAVAAPASVAGIYSLEGGGGDDGGYPHRAYSTIVTFRCAEGVESGAPDLPEWRVEFHPCAAFVTILSHTVCQS